MATDNSGKSVQNVKNSLKFKASEKQGVLSVRLGVKKFELPVTARMLSNEEYLFLSFPASSELYRIEGKELVAMDKADDASDALRALDPGKKKRGRRGGALDLPSNVLEALKSLPAGTKLVFGADGIPRLVKTRVRRKKA